MINRQTGPASAVPCSGAGVLVVFQTQDTGMSSDLSRPQTDVLDTVPLKTPTSSQPEPNHPRRGAGPALGNLASSAAGSIDQHRHQQWSGAHMGPRRCVWPAFERPYATDQNRRVSTDGDALSEAIPTRSGVPPAELGGLAIVGPSQPRPQVQQLNPLHPRGKYLLPVGASSLPLS
jgi:hypothetical protein